MSDALNRPQNTGQALTPERWRRAAPILDAAMELPDEAREAYIDAQCGGQAEVRADVLHLLAQALVTGDLLDSSAAERFAALLPDERAVPPQIGARYLVHEALGAGGTAVVYRAHDPTTRRDVAVKILHEHLASQAGRERFLREVRIAANLLHPNILPLYDAGQDENLVFYVMPLVQGGSLRQRIQTHGRLAPDAARRVLQEVAGALAFAHAQGVVHRDIKPDNVLLAEDGRAIVADFGIAKALSASEPALPTFAQTLSGMAIGTPAYMAPEQVLGDVNVDASADVYAFGAMAYELLTGQPPFTGRSGHEIAARHLSDTPVPVSTLVPDADPVLAALIMQCLRKARDERPTAAAVAEAITQHTPLPSPASTGAASATSSGPIAPATTPTKEQPWWRSPVVVMVALGALVVATAMWRMFSRDADPEVAARAASRTPFVLAAFDAPDGDSVLATMFADAVRAALSQSSTIEVLSDRRMASALRRMRADPRAPFDITRARELALREGVSAVISGGVVGNPETGFQLTLRAVAADSGEDVAHVTLAMRDASMLLNVADTLVRQLRVALGEGQAVVARSTPLPRVTTASIAALRKYSEAHALLQQGERSPRTVGLLQEAIALDTNFAMAYVLLVRAHGGDVLRSVAASALTEAYRRRDILPPAEAAFVAAQYFDLGIGGDADAAERYYREAMAYGDTGSVRNALATLRLTRGNYAGASQVLQASESRDSLDADETAILIAALAMQERDAEAEGRLAQATRQGLASPRLLALQPTLPWFRGDYEGAERVAQAQRDQPDPASRYMGLMSGNAIASTRGKFRRADSLGTAFDAMQGGAASRAELEDAAAEAIIIARVLNDPDSALAHVEAARRRHPLDKLPQVDRPFYPLALAYAFAGRPILAGAMIDSLEHLRDTTVRRGMASLLPPLRAIVATAAGAPDSALTLLRQTRRQAAGVGEYRLDAITADAHFAATRFDSAAVYYERYIRARTPDKMYGTSDPVWLASALWRLGECYETMADRPRAIAAYEQLLRLWEGADTQVAARAAELRARINRLRALTPR